jgi:predicted permease
MNTLFNDIKYSLRMLAKQPGLTLLIVLVLSLGISVSIAMFTLVDGWLHPQSPFSDPHRIVHLFAFADSTPWRQDELTYLECVALREQLNALSGLAALNYNETTLKGDQWSREIITAEVSPNFFSVSRITAFLGRLVTDNKHTEPCVILGHRFWKTHFGSDPTIIGRSILLGNTNRIVLGVVPPSFYSVGRPWELGEDSVDVWIPMCTGDEKEFKQVIGRLKPGATIQTLQMEAQIAFQRLKLKGKNNLGPLKPKVVSDYQYRSIPGYPAPAIFLTGIANVILLIACLNVSGLLLAKADIRRNEMAVRQALGASRMRLMCQLLIEGGMLAALALGCSLVIAYGIRKLMVSFFLPVDMAYILKATWLGSRAVGFSLSITLCSTLLFQFLPGWYTCRFNILPVLKADRSYYARGRQSLFGLPMLVVSQLAMALVLTVCTGLLLRSYLKADAMNLGFHNTRVLQATGLRPSGTTDQRKAFFRDLVTHTKVLAGVKNVGLGLWTPLRGRRNQQEYHVSLVGEEPTQAKESQRIQSNIVDAGYFPTTGIPILKGRNFIEQVTPSNSQQVIVNETFVARFWPNQDPIGRFIALENKDHDHAITEAVQVVGVVPDLKGRPLGKPPQPTLYIPLGQAFANSMTLLVETYGDPHLLADPIRKIIQQLDQNIDVYPMTTLAEDIRILTTGHRIFAKIMGSLSLMGMSLAGIGLYGIVAFVVSRRTHELGIRMALGARQQDVIATVMKHGFKLCLIGFALGLGGAFLLSLALRAVLFEVISFDTIVYTGASLVLTGTAALACYLPARRAAKIDPMEALRYE